MPFSVTLWVDEPASGVTVLTARNYGNHTVITALA